MSQEQFQDITIKANYYVGSNAQGGTMTIQKEYAVFTPHGFNFGDLNEKKIPIKDICGYKKGLLTILNIYLTNGTVVKLAVWKKDSIIQALEARRHAIYKNLGQEIPQLTVF